LAGKAHSTVRIRLITTSNPLFFSLLSFERVILLSVLFPTDMTEAQSSTSSTNSSSTPVTQSQHSSTKDIGSLKKDYEDLCVRLNVDIETQKLAWSLLERFYTAYHQPQNSVVRF
jgi:hypothetical protein